ncbi:hypothetical protein S40285_05123 [Stachybotrys chlorohalonatus IBT 40285]|uniref:Prenylcysteine lyase domain-containing protein n=1 Tax=Stachybotrys chlorohalonatus (strain IBT 40285) TaxID=1283841 RepID=A0A084QST0_STAC4|nr:hypothetical protein S40285_05123 [Stachybotrys chlorohalonata IBT 40285]
MQLQLNTLLAWLGVAGSVAPEDAIETSNVKNVAIIGAGAAGSSAAYHLQQYASEHGLPINITVFEKTDRVGGRTLTVNAYDNPLYPVELGASIFVSVNHIMVNATRTFDLPVTDKDGPGDITAIWNGETFVYQSARDTSWWWDATKLFWKYGTSPYTTQKLVNSVVAKFLSLYEAPYFPFRSLTQRAFELGLEKITAVTGEQFLAENKINANFSNDIIQAATRVNYASNLACIHGLEAMVSMATDGAVSVIGGNWRIFDSMVRHSGAALYTNTSVTALAYEQKKGALTKSSKYVLSTKKSGNASESTDFPVSFDNVVVANPWQFADITAGEGVLRHRIDKIPYMKLHVTLFTSPFTLQPGFFKLAPGSKAPSNVYTTLGPHDEARQGADGVGSAGFYSISTLDTPVNPETGKKEFLYKIFSPEAVTADFLTGILGVPIPSTFTAAKSDYDEVSADVVNPISWYYPHWFYSYPIELPRVTFQDPIVGDGLYYTSGMESFVSTMETSALMGKNVARLISDDFSLETSEKLATELHGEALLGEGIKVQEAGEL